MAKPKAKAPAKAKIAPTRNIDRVGPGPRGLTRTPAKPHGVEAMGKALRSGMAGAVKGLQIGVATGRMVPRVSQAATRNKSLVDQAVEAARGNLEQVSGARPSAISNAMKPGPAVIPYTQQNLNKIRKAKP